MLRYGTSASFIYRGINGALARHIINVCGGV